MIGTSSSESAAWTRLRIVAWWEKRRLAYNLYVGLMGLATIFLAIFVGSHAVQPGEDFVEPVVLVFGPLIYGFMANLCFTLGWIADLIAPCGKPRAWLYRSGLRFSMVVTAAPGMWAVTAGVYAVLTGEKL